MLPHLMQSTVRSYVFRMANTGVWTLKELMLGE